MVAQASTESGALVYELYALTAEERRIVEEEVRR